MKYTWEWTLEDGSVRKVEIETALGIETARQRALAFFPNDDAAQSFISSHDPMLN